MLKAAGPSEESHCACLPSLQRLHFTTEIKHLVHPRVVFGNYALMIATEASSLVIPLWPPSRASQFGRFFQQRFPRCLPYAKVLRAGSTVNRRDMAPSSQNFSWSQAAGWRHTSKSVAEIPRPPHHRQAGAEPGAGCWTLFPRNLNPAQNTPAVLFPRTFWVLQSYPGSLGY